MSRARTGAATLVAGVLLLTACGGGDDEEGATSTEAATTTGAGADPTAATTAAPTTAPATTAPPVTTAPPTDAAVATTAPAAPVTTAAAGPWEDPSGTFRIAFPGEPAVQNVQAPLPDGTSLPVTAYLSEVAGAAVIASCVDYPDGSVLGEDTQVLESARDGALANIGATLVESTPIEQQGRPGVEYRGEIGEAGGVLARTFIDGLQLCQALVVGEPAVVDEAAPGILASFEFVKEAA